MEESIVKRSFRWQEYKKSRQPESADRYGVYGSNATGRKITKGNPRKLDAVLGTASYGHILDAVDGAFAGQSYLKMEPLDTLPLVNTSSQW